MSTTTNVFIEKHITSFYVNIKISGYRNFTSSLLNTRLVQKNKSFIDLLCTCFSKANRIDKGVCAVRGYFGPPMRPKNENCFSQISSF